MSEAAANSPSGPIERLSCEMLREIFAHCLPDPPVVEFTPMKPDTTIAPMLLCQICFSWRTIALEYPSLWSHLSYHITIIIDGNHLAWVFKGQIEFLSFWRKNSGSIPPFLHLSIHWQHWTAVTPKDNAVMLSSVEAQFLPEYFTSAQYIKSDAAYWSLVQEWYRMGYQVHHPNLHTNVVERQWFQHDAFYDFETLFTLQSHHHHHHHHHRGRSPLRRLAMVCAKVPADFLVPSRWFNLTDISMGSVTFSISFWFSLIRSLPFLQRGYFDIRELVVACPYNKPTPCTLHHLSSLFLYCSQEYANSSQTIKFPLSLLFQGLSIPSLHTLSTSSYASSWSQDNHGLTELYNVLKSVPATALIALGDGFLPFGPNGRDDGVIPIWYHLPHLSELSLELPDASYRPKSEVIRTYGSYLSKLLLKSWLSLNAADCPIKNITLVNHHFSDLKFNSLAEATATCIKRYAEKVPKITFRLTSYSKRWEVAHEYKEWDLDGM